jgi:hypothetical protein
MLSDVLTWSSECFAHAPNTPCTGSSDVCSCCSYRRSECSSELLFHRVQAEALAASIVQWDSKDVDAFIMITGVSDSSCWNK